MNLLHAEMVAVQGGNSIPIMTFHTVHALTAVISK